jgi:hypothetical protein
MTYLAIKHKMAVPPLPEPDWIGLLKWISACISGVFGFGWGVDQYFKYLKQQKIEANRLARIEKEEFIKSVVNESVTMAIADIRDDIKDLKDEQKGIRKQITDIYRDMKR